MRISQFQVERYRSIQTSETLKLQDSTVLVGPNNEGKSNLLRALVVGLGLLESFRPENIRRVTRTQVRSSLTADSYRWANDFPVSARDNSREASSSFTFEFSLSEDETREFRREVGSNLNGSLKVRILIGKDDVPILKVVKKGPGGATLNRKLREISQFISRRIAVDYVPAVRSSDEVERIVESELRLTLQALRSRNDFAQALQVLQGVLSNGVADYEAILLRNLQQFLPTVKAVGMDVGDALSRSLFLGMRMSLTVDDGVATPLAAKGDGVQSLAMVALKMSAVELDQSRFHVIALEEPEAHLHPGAVRSLRDVLVALSNEHQVVISTHSPILVDRDAPARNVLVNQNRARPARSVEEVRKSLGVEMPDNMVSSEVVVLVEGPSDARVLRSLMRQDPQLLSACTTGRLAVRSMQGAQNAGYSYRLWQEKLCRIHVVLDGDREGRSARNKLLETGCPDLDITMLSALDHVDMELEDLLSGPLVEEVLRVHFRVAYRADFHEDPAHRLKFSQEVQRLFKEQGRPWDAHVAASLKDRLAMAAVGWPEALDPKFDPLMNSLFNAVRDKVTGSVSAVPGPPIVVQTHE